MSLLPPPAAPAAMPPADPVASAAQSASNPQPAPQTPPPLTDPHLVGKQGLDGPALSTAVDPVTGLPRQTPAPNLMNSQGAQPGQAAAASAQSPDKSSQDANTQPAGPVDPETQPITDFGKVDLQLGQAQVDPQLLAGFGQTATEIGLTPKQARALAQWQTKVVEETVKARHVEQEKLLNASWGRDRERHVARVVSLCQKLDRMPEVGDFSGELARSGGGDNAVVVKGLAALAGMLGEDSMGVAQGSAPTRPQTAYEGIADAFRRARESKGVRYGL